MIETLGRLLRQRRKELGMTQEQLEDLSGVSQNEISKLENDRVQYPRPEILSKLTGPLELEMDQMKRALGWVVIAGEGVMLPIKGLVPADSVRFAASEGASVSEIEVLAADIEGARSPYGLEVSGDCLRSIGILSGDVVIVEPAEGRTPKHNQLVVLRLGDEVTMKRWRERDDGMIELRDGDETIVHQIDPEHDEDVEVLAFYVTFKPIAPR